GGTRDPRPSLLALLALAGPRAAHRGGFRRRPARPSRHGRGGAVSVRYAAVKWNRNKRVYDVVLAAGVVLYLALFVLAGRLVWPGISIEILLIRALGTCAYLMLHVV